MGNLTRDPEVTYTPKGTAVCEIGLAVNEYWTDDQGEKMEDTVFVDITFFGNSAETIQQYMSKGRPIYVEGKLKLDQWEDKQTGQKRSKMRVIGRSFQFLGGKKDNDDKEDKKPRQQGSFKRGGKQQGGEYDQSAAPRRPSPPPQKPQDPDLDQPEDDIPF